MNNALFEEIVKTDCEFLKADGFNFLILDHNVLFDKTMQDRTLRMSFACIPYGHQFNLHGLSAYIRFNEVEKSIHQIKGGDISWFFTIHISPDEGGIPSGLLYVKTEKNYHFEIREPEDLHRFINFVKTFYFTTAVPFFETNSSVLDVYARTSVLPDEHLSNYLCGSGNTFFLRHYAVKHLFMPDQAEAYYQRVQAELEKHRGNRAIDTISNELTAFKKKFINT